MSNAEDLTAAEKRKRERQKISDVLTVMDVHSERLLGRVVDLSVEGLMLISQVPIEVNRIFELKIQLPMRFSECTEIRVGVESLWTRESDDGTQYWTGFHIICISDQDQHCIETMLSHV